MKLYTAYNNAYNFTRGDRKMFAFIPKPYKTETVTIRVQYEKLEYIDRIATGYNLSRNAFINQCIDYALEHMSSRKEEAD